MTGYPRGYAAGYADAPGFPFGATVKGVRDRAVDVAGTGRRMVAGSTDEAVDDGTVADWVLEYSGEVMLALVGADRLPTAQDGRLHEGALTYEAVRHRARGLVEMAAASLLSGATRSQGGASGSWSATLWDRYQKGLAGLAGAVERALALPDDADPETPGTQPAGDVGAAAAFPCRRLAGGAGF